MHPRSGGYIPVVATPPLHPSPWRSFASVSARPRQEELALSRARMQEQLEKEHQPSSLTLLQRWKEAPPALWGWLGSCRAYASIWQPSSSSVSYPARGVPMATLVARWWRHQPRVRFPAPNLQTKQRGISFHRMSQGQSSHLPSPGYSSPDPKAPAASAVVVDGPAVLREWAPRSGLLACPVLLNQQMLLARLWVRELYWRWQQVVWATRRHAPWQQQLPGQMGQLAVVHLASARQRHRSPIGKGGSSY